MFDYIKGKLVSKQQSAANGACFVIENNGLGYLVNTTNRNISIADEQDSEIKVYTALIHREDAMILCGFLNREDRDIFNILLSVPGVGMKVALVLLDEFSGCELISVVIRGDFKELSRAKGVGPKLAQKIILELKDKLINRQKNSPISLSDIPEISVSNEIKSQALDEVHSVLLSLGYSDEEARTAIKQACATVSKPDSSENILKEALRYLSQD